MVRLTGMNGSFAIHRLSPDHPIPAEILRSEWFSVSRSPEELSIVCSSSLDLGSASVSQGWKCFKVEGPLDFSLVGILSGLANPLAEAGIPIFAISTFDTDYILVREGSFEAARAALRAAGFMVG